MTSASLPGNQWAKRASVFEQSIARDLTANGINAQAGGLQYIYNTSMTTEAREFFEKTDEGSKKRKEVTPDILAYIPVGDDPTAARLPQTYDSKSINHGPTHYPEYYGRRGRPPDEIPPVSKPVETRERLVSREYENKLRNIDTKFNGTPPDTIGPMRTALRSYGGCQGLISGYYGDLSPGYEELIKTTAAVGAMRQAYMYGLDPDNSTNHIRSVIANKVRTRWAMMVFRENAMLKLVNIKHIQGYRAAGNPMHDVGMQDSWSRLREEYRYAGDDYHGPRNCGFGFGRR